MKSLRDFLNAGGGVGDYDIEIHRSSGVQRIPIVSLMPEHDELKRDPTLLQVICEAKRIAGDKRPPWCPNSPDSYPKSLRPGSLGARRHDVDHLHVKKVGIVGKVEPVLSDESFKIVDVRLPAL